MVNKIKIPFALQKGTVATLCIACALFFIPAGCGNEENLDPIEIPLLEFSFDDEEEAEVGNGSWLRTYEETFDKTKH